MGGPGARDEVAADAPGELPARARTRRPDKVALVFVAVYLAAVAIAAVLMGPEVRSGWILAVILAAPAIWAIGITLPGILRNPVNPALAAMQLVLLPILAAIFIGGPGVLIALSLSRFFEG